MITQGEMAAPFEGEKGSPALVTGCPLPSGTDLVKLAEREKSMLAAANKTPAVVLDALEPGSSRIAGKEAHVFSVQTYINLTRLKSPFVEQVAGQTVTIEDVARALWAMVESDDKVRYAIRTGGDFLDTKIAEFASQIPFSDIESVAAAIAAHIAAGFATAAKMNPPKQEGNGESPLDMTSSATAPAGS